MRASSSGRWTSPTSIRSRDSRRRSRSIRRRPRATPARPSGTVTEIYDYLRLLWARIGHPHCHICGRPISGQSAEQIIDQVMELPEGTRFMVMAPIVRGRKGEYGKQLEELRGEGFTRAKIDGELRRLDEEIVARQEVQARHRDRGRPPGHEERAAQAAGRLDRDRGGAGRRAGRDRAGRHRRASRPTRRSSPVRCTGRAWSSSSRASSASTRRTGRVCAARGSGRRWRSIPSWSCPIPTLSIGEGAIAPWAASASDYYDQLIQAIAERYDVDLDTSWEELPDQAQGLLPVRDQR